MSLPVVDFKLQDYSMNRSRFYFAAQLSSYAKISAL